jgi:hypothetical protein
MPVSAPDSPIASTHQRQQVSCVTAGGYDQVPRQSSSWKTTTPPGFACAATFAQHHRRIGLELQHIPADHRVERPLERELGRVAVAKRDVAEPARCRLCGRGPDCFGRTVNADDLAGVAHDRGGQKRDVPGAAADVEYSHAG